MVAILQDKVVAMKFGVKIRTNNQQFQDTEL